MRFLVTALSLIFLAGAVLATDVSESEQDIINKFLKKTEKKHTTKLSWISVNFAANRINRSSEYNDFATLVSNDFSNASIPGLSQASSFGLDFGLHLNTRLAVLFGGEYWLKLGSRQSGSFDYNPPQGSNATVTELVSEIQVFGLTTGAQYHLLNPPTANEATRNASLFFKAHVGFFWADWDLWQDFENLNLSTATPVDNNTTFGGSAPGFSFGVGGDYPLNFFDLALGADFTYLYLNFDNVAWYNSQDEEIIVTHDGTEAGRIDLELSGFRGKIELKRYFRW